MSIDRFNNGPTDRSTGISIHPSIHRLWSKSQPQVIKLLTLLMKYRLTTTDRLEEEEMPY